MKIFNLFETTSSGSIATVSQPVGAIQKRMPKGSNLFKGIKSSKKYPNNIHEGKFAFDHDPECPYHQGLPHACEMKTPVHARDCPHNYGHECSCGYEEYVSSVVNEKAVSKKQQQFFGMVRSIQQGKKIPGASKEMKNVAKTMGKQDVKDYASTKTKGLPTKVDETQSPREVDQKIKTHARIKTPPSGYHKKNDSIVPELEITENDLVLAPGKSRQFKPGLLYKPVMNLTPTDVIKIDVPLLIKLFEYAREEAASDIALHSLAEKLISMSGRGRTLSMKDYADIIDPVHEGLSGAIAGGIIGAAVPEIGGPVTGAKIGSEIQDLVSEGTDELIPGQQVEVLVDRKWQPGVILSGFPSGNWKVRIKINNKDVMYVSPPGQIRAKTVDEVSNSTVSKYLKGAMYDTIKGHKDRNPGMKRAINQLAGNKEPLIPTNSRRVGNE